MACRLAIISPYLGFPSGLPAVVQRLAGTLLREGAQLTLIGEKAREVFPTQAVAKENSSNTTDPATKGPSTEATDGPEIEWWPAEEFADAERSRLCYHVEQLIAQRQVDRIIAFGVTRCGFTSVVASRLTGVPISVFVTYRDAFTGLVKAPAELDTVARFADHLIATNPEVLSHLGRFYDVAGKTVLLDSRACAVPFAVEAAPLRGETDAPGYVVTTGLLDSAVHLPTLVERIQRGFRETGASSWTHAGTIDPSSNARLMQMLASHGMTESFTATGVLQREHYERLVCGARTLIRLDGGHDSNLAAYEAELSGVKVMELEGDVFPRHRDASSSVPSPPAVDWSEVCQVLLP